MRKMILILLSFTFVSCATTKVFETETSHYKEYDDRTTLIQTTETIEAIYEPNTKIILFDIFCMPTITVGLLGWNALKISCCTLTSPIWVPLLFTMGDRLPVLNPIVSCIFTDSIEKELEELDLFFKQTDYMKYSKYVKHAAKTTLNIQILKEEINLYTNESRVISKTNFTLIYIDNIQDSIKRYAKKFCLTGNLISNNISFFLTKPIMLLIINL